MFDYEKRLFDKYNGENPYTITLETEKEERTYWNNITEKELEEIIRRWTK